MFCTSCGKPIPDGSKFCPECGASFVANAQPQQAVPQYQVPPQYGYAPAPKSGFSFSAIWNNPSKRPLLFMLGIALTCFIVYFFRFTYWFGGYDLLFLGDCLSSWMLIFSFLAFNGIIVFCMLDIFNVKLSRSVLKTLYMVLSICFGAFSTLTFIGCLSEFGDVGFGSILYLLFGGGMVFVYFFMLHKTFNSSPAAM